jgi:hypothetical protein
VAANTTKRDQSGANSSSAKRVARTDVEPVPAATLTLTLEGETKRKRALAALAMAGGNRSAAARAVPGVSRDMLKRYVRDFPEEYEQVRRDLAPQIEAAVVEEMRGFIVEAGRVKSRVLERIDAALDLPADEGGIPSRDLPQTLRNVAASQGTAIDKTLSLSGRPSQVVEHRSASELLERLQKLGALKRPGHDAEATATEITAESG